MASITPNNGRVDFVSAWDPHTYWELNSTNLGTNYGDDTSGNDDNSNVASGDISTQESYDGMNSQNDPPANGWFDIYIVTDAAALVYIPAGLSHGTNYGLFHNGGGVHAQAGWLRATTTGVEVCVSYNQSTSNRECLIEEIPDADLPGWFCIGFQYCSEGGAQGDMGLWINGSKVRSGTRGYQLSYGSGNPDFGNSAAREPEQAGCLDPSDYSGGNWGANTAINGSGILIANFTCDNPNQDNSSPDGNGDSFHSDYYDEHTVGATHYSLTVDPANFSFAGISQDILKDSLVVPGTESFGFTGTAANLLKGYAIDASAESFGLTGTATDLLRGYLVVPGAGAFPLSGTATDLLRGYLVVPGAGAFPLSGTAADLLAARLLTPSTVNFPFVGFDATLTLGGAYALEVDSGIFPFAGFNADLTYSPIAVTVKKGHAYGRKQFERKRYLIDDEQEIVEIMEFILKSGILD